MADPSFDIAIKQEGYVFDLDLAITRTQMANGTARVRKDTPKRTAIRASLILNAEQLQAFEAFAMLYGHNWFTATIQTGDGVRSESVRMVGNFSHSLLSGLHNVSFVLELKTHANELVAESLSVEELEAVFAFGKTDIQASALLNDPLLPLVGAY